MAGGTPAK